MSGHLYVFNEIHYKKNIVPSMVWAATDARKTYELVAATIPEADAWFHSYPCLQAYGSFTNPKKMHGLRNFESSFLGPALCIFGPFSVFCLFGSNEKRCVRTYWNLLSSGWGFENYLHPKDLVHFFGGQAMVRFRHLLAVTVRLGRASAGPRQDACLAPTMLVL